MIKEKGSCAGFYYLVKNNKSLTFLFYSLFGGYQKEKRKEEILPMKDF
jgi:hypothetical protein